MQLKKLKREFFGKIPVLIFAFFIVSAFLSGLFFVSKEIISKYNFVISPLARSMPQKGNEIEFLLGKNNIPFNKVLVASDSSYMVMLKDQGEVDFDSKRNLKEQISSLQLILSRLTIEGKKFKRLDLRFNEPVIEF